MRPQADRKQMSDKFRPPTRREGGVFQIRSYGSNYGDNLGS